jgi:hypothetical protein
VCIETCTLRKATALSKIFFFEWLLQAVVEHAVQFIFYRIAAGPFLRLPGPLHTLKQLLYMLLRLFLVTHLWLCPNITAVTNICYPRCFPLRLCCIGPCFLPQSAHVVLNFVGVYCYGLPPRSLLAVAVIHPLCGGTCATAVGGKHLFLSLFSLTKMSALNPHP